MKLLPLALLILTTNVRAFCDRPQAGVKIAEINAKGLKENSGIDFSQTHRNVFWSLNDSGPTAVFAIGADGANLARFEITGAAKVDWEDIALAECFHRPEKDCIYLADIGNNDRDRSEFTVYVVEEPSTLQAAGNLAVAETIKFKVPGLFNFEAMVVNSLRDELLFISKSDKIHTPKGVSSVFSLARGQREATLIATLDFNQLPFAVKEKDKIVTAADLDLGSQTLLLGTNDNAFEVKLEELALFTSKAKKIKVPKLEQAEAIAYYGKNGRPSIAVTGEGKQQPLFFISCE